MADRTVDAEAVGVRIATESAPGTAPSSDWTLALQPNPGGIKGFTRKNDTVERDPLSVYGANEKGDIVGHKAEIQLTVDFTPDVCRYMAPSMFRSAADVCGGATTSTTRPTAVVDGGGSADSFTHAALSAALAAGILIRTQGFANSANNGVFVVQSGGSTTSTKVLTGLLVAETGVTTPALPGNQILEVCGVQAASGDVTMTASNHLASTVLDFTTLGLVKGSVIILGDTDIGTRFATLPTDDDCYAVVKSAPTANLLELEDHSWTVAGVDAAGSKTIRIMIGDRYANRARNHAKYSKPTHNIEKEDQNAATSNTVPIYTYGNGCALGSWKLTAPLKNKITAEFSFCGLNIASPVLNASRKTGASTAYAPLSSALFDTSNDLDAFKVKDSSGDLVAEINNWSLTCNLNVKPKEVQGTNGAIGHIHGKFEPMFDLDAYFNDKDQTAAVNDNRTCKSVVLIGNHQGGFAIRMPYTALRGGDQEYPANDAVMIKGTTPGFRDPDSNVVMEMTRFAYVPFGGQ